MYKRQNDGRQILEHFDLEVDSSEVVGLIAPSGYGKTTLCKILGGYQKPDGGEVLLDGKPLRDIKGCCPVQMIWQHPEQAVNPRLRMRAVSYTHLWKREVEEYDACTAEDID